MPVCSLNTYKGGFNPIFTMFHLNQIVLRVCTVVRFLFISHFKSVFEFEVFVSLSAILYNHLALLLKRMYFVHSTVVFKYSVRKQFKHSIF